MGGNILQLESRGDSPIIIIIIVVVVIYYYNYKNRTRSTDIKEDIKHKISHTSGSTKTA